MDRRGIPPTVTWLCAHLQAVGASIAPLSRPSGRRVQRWRYQGRKRTGEAGHCLVSALGSRRRTTKEQKTRNG